MNYIKYFKRLGLSDYIISKVLPLINRAEYSKYIDELTGINAEETYLKIKKDYPDDEKSFIILTIYLLASIKTLGVYKARKIPKKIFYDTLKCIARFIAECKVMNNDEYFDRDFWVHKQLSSVIYRIGELEYEFINESISIHIPSDAVLKRKSIIKSLNKLRRFINKYYPTYKGKLIYCDSWLLSPNLAKYLDDDSNILTFQSFFEIKEFNEENKEFVGWLFQTKNHDDIGLLKEETSLQRKVKEALLSNEKIGSAYGILKY